jgi:hypothetical protein
VCLETLRCTETLCQCARVAHAATGCQLWEVFAHELVAWSIVSSMHGNIGAGRSCPSAPCVRLSERLLVVQSPAPFTAWASGQPHVEGSKKGLQVCAQSGGWCCCAGKVTTPACFDTVVVVTVVVDVVTVKSLQQVFWAVYAA